MQKTEKRNAKFSVMYDGYLALYMRRVIEGWSICKT